VKHLIIKDFVLIINYTGMFKLSRIACQRQCQSLHLAYIFVVAHEEDSAKWWIRFRREARGATVCARYTRRVETTANS